VYPYIPKNAVKYERRSDGKYKVYIYARFRKFNNYTESVIDRSSFLKLKWYKRACEADNPFDAARYLIDTGYPGYAYATDPNYPNAIISIIKSNNLTKYDLPKPKKGDEDNMPMQLPNYLWEAIVANIAADVQAKKLDAMWLDKARNRTLTAAELAAITFLRSRR